MATSYRVEGNTLVQVIAVNANTAFPVVADPSLWKITKCAGSIGAAIASFAIPIPKILKLKKFINAVGGIREAARLLTSATTAAEKRRVVINAIGTAGAEILSIDSIIANC